MAQPTIQRVGELSRVAEARQDVLRDLVSCLPSHIENVEREPDVRRGPWGFESITDKDEFGEAKDDGYRDRRSVGTEAGSP